MFVPGTLPDDVPTNQAPGQPIEWTTDPKIQDIWRSAGQQLNAGVAPPAVHRNLIEQGHDPQLVAEVVDRLAEAKAAGILSTQPVAAHHAHQEAGRNAMLIGGLICAAGIIATVVSMAAAGGGK